MKTKTVLQNRQIDPRALIMALLQVYLRLRGRVREPDLPQNVQPNPEHKYPHLFAFDTVLSISEKSRDYDVYTR